LLSEAKQTLRRRAFTQSIRQQGSTMYVYLLESVAFPGRRYVGLTIDLHNRLEDHNAGKSPHTSKYRPWRIVAAAWFADRAKAEAFELTSNPAPATPLPNGTCGDRWRAAKPCVAQVLRSFSEAGWRSRKRSKGCDRVFAIRCAKDARKHAKQAGRGPEDPGRQIRRLPPIPRQISPVTRASLLRM
jgi:predicted GIY-YIG superfamily endonuclease